MRNLYNLYKKACTETSDMFKHCPTLHDLAKKSSHVTEIGLNSTAALVSILAAKPQKVIAYNRNCDKAKKIGEQIRPLVKSTELIIKHGDPLKIGIELTDFLFIDSYHTYRHLKKELQLHGGKTRKFIAIHDTWAFADRGEDGSMPGLPEAINEFVRDNKEWKIIKNVRHNNGMIVLQRTPQDGPDFDRTYSMVSFDLPDVRWVERYTIGVSNPYKHQLTEDEVRQQVDLLNRALRYGIIVAVERNFTTLKIDGNEIDTWYVVYHVGFKRRPPGK
jgi:hypothetical protein